MTEPTRCFGRSERHALQQAHHRFPGGFEIVGWKRLRNGFGSPVELALRPIRVSLSRERARLRLLACVNGLQASGHHGSTLHQPDHRATHRTPIEPPTSTQSDSHVVLATPQPNPAGQAVWAFVGSPGSGVTRVVAGLAQRFQGRDRCTIGLISAGDETHAHDLRSFADATGLPMHAAISAASLAETAAWLGHRSLLLVDFPGIGPRDGDRLVAQARSLECLAATVTFAVLAADADAVALERQLQVYSRMGATHIVLSRVDLAARLEPAIGAIAASGLAFAWVTHGTSEIGDLSPASQEWVDRATDRLGARS